MLAQADEEIYNRLTSLMEVTGLRTPTEVANEMVREAQVWQENNPGKDVMDVITPEWQEYINHKIKHLC